MQKLSKEELLRIVEAAEARSEGRPFPPGDDTPPIQADYGDLDDEDDGRDDGDGDALDRGPSKQNLKQAEILLALAQAETLFHTPAGDPYADIDVKGHRETHRLKSKTFRQWLARRYFLALKSAPNSEAM